MNLKKLAVISTSLLSLNASAVICEVELQTKRGRVLDQFFVDGPSISYSCGKALRDCKIAQKMLANEGRNQQSICKTITQDITQDNRPGSGGTVSRPTRPAPPTRPTIPSRPSPGGGHNSYAIDRIEDTIQSGGWQARKYALQELANYSSIRALKIALKSISDSDSDVRNQANSTLNIIVNKMDTQSLAYELIEQIPQLMKNSGWKTRQVGAKVLGKVGTAQAIIPLMSYITDSDSDVRNAVKQSISTLKNSYDFEQSMKVNLPALKQFLKNGGWIARQESVKIMGEAQIMLALSQVVKATGDSDSDVRNSASKSLKQLTSNHAIKYVSMSTINQLIKLYKTSGWKVRMNSIKTMAATKNEMVLNTIYDALDDSDSDVRRAAKVALDNFRY